MNFRKPLSGLSLAFKHSMGAYRKGRELINKTSPSEFSIKVANTLLERESAYQLSYQVYLEKGFIKPNKNNWLIQEYDFNKETVILIVQDKYKNIAWTVILVFDGYSKLPAEKIYHDELKLLRRQKEKIVEISRLVINPQYRNAKEILILLFNYLYIYSSFVQKYTCLTIEVNPRYKAYYQALLHFNEIGVMKPCPSVQSAPAILMYVPLKHMQEEVVRLSNINEVEKNNRSLYRYLLKLEQQRLVSHYLEKQVKEISREEKEYFGYSNTNDSHSFEKLELKF